MKYLAYREEKVRGTFDFPLAFYHVSETHPRYQMSHHWHMECELIRIVKGKLRLMVDRQEYILKEGDVAYITDGDLHGGLPDACIYECLVFDLPSLFSAVKPCRITIQGILNHTLIVNPLFDHAHPKIHEIVWSLFEAVKTKEPGYELTVLGHLYRFYGYVVEHHYYQEVSLSDSQKSTNRILQLKSALEMIENDYASCITLEDLAKCAGMNAKYFCRFFNEMTHRTPIDYLNSYRIESACFKLITSDSSITEVALSCGFNDISYFIKTFKRYKGVTPKQYLKSPLSPRRIIG